MERHDTSSFSRPYGRPIGEARPAGSATGEDDTAIVLEEE